MDDIEFAEDGGGVGGEDHLLQMVDDDLVAAIRTQRGLDGRGYGTAGVDVAQNGSIFGIVAKRGKDIEISIWIREDGMDVR